MKYIINLLLFFFILNNSFAQQTIIHGKLPSMKGSSIKIGRPTKWLVYDAHKAGLIEGEIAQNGEFNLNLDAVDKEIVFISIWDKLNDNRLFFQYIYITKGDNLFLLEDFDKEIRISGKGEKHNQLKGISDDAPLKAMPQDSLPDLFYY